MTERYRRYGWFVLGAILFGCPCGSAPLNTSGYVPPSLDPAAPRTRPPERHLGGGDPDVDLLARALLIRGQEAEPGFAYYSYLLFADRSEGSFAARRAAAIGYMKLLDDASEVARLVPRDRMAVLYAPIQSADAARACFATKDPQILLDRYDYPRARLLMNALGERGARLPPVALVGSAVPIGDAGAIDPDELFVVSLATGSEQEVEGRMLSFRDELETGQSALGASGPPAAMVKAKAFFRLIGITLRELAALPLGSG